MLPATEKPSPAVWPHQSMQAVPVCAAMRPCRIHDVHLTVVAAVIAGGERLDDLRRRHLPSCSNFRPFTP